MAIGEILVDDEDVLPLVACTKPIRLDTLGTLGSLKPALHLSVASLFPQRVAYSNLALLARVAAFGTSSNANHNACLGKSELGDE